MDLCEQTVIDSRGNTWRRKTNGFALPDIGVVYKRCLRRRLFPRELKFCTCPFQLTRVRWKCPRIGYGIAEKIHFDDMAITYSSRNCTTENGHLKHCAELMYSPDLGHLRKRLIGDPTSQKFTRAINLNSTTSRAVKFLTKKKINNFGTKSNVWRFPSWV